MSKARNLADLLSSDGKVEADDLSVGQLGGRRNLIINGAMQVAQRGTSVTGSLATYGLDRWRMYSAASITMSQQSFTVGQTDVEGFPKNYMRVVPTTTVYEISQRIEDITTVGGKTLTLSFWIKGSSAATFGINCTRNYGSGGSAADSFTLGTSFNVTTSWAKITHTFAVSSILGKTVGDGSYFQFTLGGIVPFGSGQTIELANAQLEVGEVATPFEHRSYGEELALCQRYFNRAIFYKGGVRLIPVHRYTLTTGNPYANWSFPVNMRVSPTFSYRGTWKESSGYAGVPQALRTFEDGALIRGLKNVSANQTVYLEPSSTSADTGFYFDAEL